MAQSSVELLVEKLIESGVNLLSEEIKFIEQAKEMHKAECISFVEKWEGIKRWDNKEDLYNHIYKK